MRKFLCSFIVFFLITSILRPDDARAELPAKAKAFLTMAGYGAGGGALLGVATMAFGNSTRAVAQGASLGLYAGLLFGSYVLISHYQKQSGNYDDNSSPYQESSDIYGDEYNSEEGGGGEDDSGSRRGGFFDRFQVMQEHVLNQSFTFESEKRKGKSLPPIQLNLFQYSF
jgi:hypothetical protein